MSQTPRYEPSESPSEPPPEPPKGALFTIFTIAVTDFLGLGIIIPNMPFFVPDYQSNAMAVTLLFSVYSICQFVAAPVMGAISDRLGRRPVLIWSQMGSVLGYLVLAFSMQFHWHSMTTTLLLIYLSRIIDGISGGNISTAQAYISDITTAQTRARGMGMLGAAFGIGFSFGAGAGGILGHYHLSLPGYAAALFSLGAAIQTWIRLPESRIHKPADIEVWLHPRMLKPILRQPVLMGFMAIAFLSMAAFLMMESTIGLYLNKSIGATQRGMGFYFIGIGIIIIGVQGVLVGRWTKRYGEWPLATFGPILVAVSMVVFIIVGWAAHRGMAFTPLLLLVGAGGILGAIGRSLQQPTLSSLVSHAANPGEQGLVFGLYHGTSSLARIAGPMLAGWTYTSHAYLCYGAAGVILLAAGIWTAIMRSRLTRAAATRPDSPLPISLTLRRIPPAHR